MKHQKFDPNSDTIYNFYVFDDKKECADKHWSNLKKFNKIKDFAQVKFYGVTHVVGVPHAIFEVIESDGITLSDDEKALIAGFGNLACGYIKQKIDDNKTLFGIALNTQGI